MRSSFLFFASAHVAVSVSESTESCNDKADETTLLQGRARVKMHGEHALVQEEHVDHHPTPPPHHHTAELQTSRTNFFKDSFTVKKNGHALQRTAGTKTMKVVAASSSGPIEMVRDHVCMPDRPALRMSWPPMDIYEQPRVDTVEECAALCASNAHQSFAHRSGGNALCDPGRYEEFCSEDCGHFSFSTMRLEDYPSNIYSIPYQWRTNCVLIPSSGDGLDEDAFCLEDASSEVSGAFLDVLNSFKTYHVAPVDPTVVMVDGCENQNVEVSREAVPLSAGRTASVRCCDFNGETCTTIGLDGGCGDHLRDRTFTQAAEICEQNGKRLCTEQEIQNRICCGTGCQHDGHQVWVFDASA